LGLRGRDALSAATPLVLLALRPWDEPAMLRFVAAAEDEVSLTEMDEVAPGAEKSRHGLGSSLRRGHSNTCNANENALKKYRLHLRNLLFLNAEWKR
jgi:hypothetical protein